MSDKPETIAAILAEFRAFALRAADEDKMISPESVLLLADKVDAAAAREREAYCDLCKEKDATIDRLLVERDKATGIPGNAAALREALAAFVDSIQWVCEGDESGRIRKQFAVLLSEARAALAAPARNCDVGTAEEQAERHERFCAAHYKADAVDAQCFGCPASDKKETDCEFVWWQLPFAPAKGGDHA